MLKLQYQTPPYHVIFVFIVEYFLFPHLWEVFFFLSAI